MDRFPVLILILIIGALIIFYLFRNRIFSPQVNRSPTPASTPIPSIAPTTISGTSDQPAAVVRSFYSWYLSCSRISSNCDYSSQPTVNTAKIKLLPPSVQGNPIICSQNLPQSYDVGPIVEIGNEKDSVYVTESLSQFNQQFVVELEQQDNSWKIVNIICPGI